MLKIYNLIIFFYYTNIIVLEASNLTIFGLFYIKSRKLQIFVNALYIISYGLLIGLRPPLKNPHAQTLLSVIDGVLGFFINPRK